MNNDNTKQYLINDELNAENESFTLAQIIAQNEFFQISEKTFEQLDTININDMLEADEYVFLRVA